MKKNSIISLAAAFALFLFFMGVAAFSVDYGPATVVVDDTTKATDRYLGITFNHQNHTINYGIACLTCHHTEKKDFVSGTPAQCEACHKADAAVTFKDAMHKDCVICHIDETAKGKTNAPTECLGCHTQRK
jgi:hypothetical protein